jgi:hypothetical protein
MCRLLGSSVLLAICIGSLFAAPPKDTAAAAATRKQLQTKVSVDYEKATLAEIQKDLVKKVKTAGGGDLKMQIDNSGGVSGITLFTFKAKDKPVAEILDKLFDKTDLGYLIIPGSYRNYKRHDGYLLIVKGKERGYVIPVEEPK